MKMGYRIMCARSRKGMSLDDLAAATGMSKSSVWNMENDKSDPWVSSLVKVAAALGVSVGFLATGADDGFSQGYGQAIKDIETKVAAMRPPSN